MVPIESQERPNIKSVYTCSNCEKALFDGDDDHPRWNFCPMCGQEIEWDKSAKVVWEEKTVISVAVGLLSATLQVLVCLKRLYWDGYLLHLLARGVPCDQLPWL